MGNVRCRRCGGENVESTAMVNPNTSDVREFVSGLDWCCDCESEVALDWGADESHGMPVEPDAGCRCCGFAVFNVPDDSPDGVTGGDVQRCDECDTFTDTAAADALTALGCKVVLKVEPRSVYFRVVSVNPRALPALRMLGILPKQ